MSTAIINRVIEEANFMLETGHTIRQVASHFGISKSTVHKDLGERLSQIDLGLYQRVGRVLQYHMEVRHLRGGESTKKKYLKLRN